MILISKSKKHLISISLLLLLIPILLCHEANENLLKVTSSGDYSYQYHVTNQKLNLVDIKYIRKISQNNFSVSFLPFLNFSTSKEYYDFVRTYEYSNQFKLGGELFASYHLPQFNSAIFIESYNIFQNTREKMDAIFAQNKFRSDIQVGIMYDKYQQNPNKSLPGQYREKGFQAQLGFSTPLLETKDELILKNWPEESDYLIDLNFKYASSFKKYEFKTELSFQKHLNPKINEALEIKIVNGVTKIFFEKLVITPLLTVQFIKEESGNDWLSKFTGNLSSSYYLKDNIAINATFTGSSSDIDIKSSYGKVSIGGTYYLDYN